MKIDEHLRRAPSWESRSAFAMAHMIRPQHGWDFRPTTARSRAGLGWTILGYSAGLVFILYCVWAAHHNMSHLA